MYLCLMSLCMASDIGQSLPNDAEHLLIERRRKQGSYLQFGITWDAGGGGKAPNFFLYAIQERVGIECLCPQITNGTASSGQRGTRTLHGLSDNLLRFSRVFFSEQCIDGF